MYIIYIFIISNIIHTHFTVRLREIDDTVLVQIIVRKMIQIIDIIDSPFTPRRVPPTAPGAIATKDVASAITTAVFIIPSHFPAKTIFEVSTTLSIARVDRKQGKEKDERKPG